MKRTAMFIIGLVLAYGAAWLGQQVTVQLPSDPSTANELWRQIYTSETAITLYVAIASSIVTAILILYHIVNFARSKSHIWTSNGFVFVTMLTFVGAAYSFGAFAHPFDYGQHPLQWFALGRQWNVALAALSAPPAALFVLMACELFSRTFKRKDPLQQQIDRFYDQISRLETPIATLRQTLADDRKAREETLNTILQWVQSGHKNLETYRNAFGERMGKLEPAVAAIADSLKEHRSNTGWLSPAIEHITKSIEEQRSSVLADTHIILQEQNKLAIAVAALSGPRLVEPPAKQRAAGDNIG